MTPPAEVSLVNDKPYNYPALSIVPVGTGELK